MPAVTTVAFDSLLHRGAGQSPSSSAPAYEYLTLRPRREEAGDGRPQGEAQPRRSSSSNFSYYISSPALYTTPEPAQLAGSSAAMCVSPSPYVVNHKRREWPVAAAPVAPAGKADSNGHVQAADREAGTERGTRADAVAVQNGVLGVTGCNGVELAANGEGDGQADKEELEEEEVDDFFNPKGPIDDGDSETEERSSFSLPRPREPGTTLLNQSEFYDAPEDFFSDGSATQLPRHLELESELRSMRLNLFEEIERRKKAEESLARMKSEWRKMNSCFSMVGLSFPPIPDGQDADGEDPVSNVCQEFVITRLISEAFERDLARAEAEASSEVVIESKNREISRLCDRLQYYEAVNHEMSQRNQEEKARLRQQKRRSRQRLLWGCIGLSVTIGASLLAHSYLLSPGTGGKSLESVDSSFEPSLAATKPTSA